jgi:hypothetical protein
MTFSAKRLNTVAIRQASNIPAARSFLASSTSLAARGWKQDDQFFMYHRFPASK